MSGEKRYEIAKIIPVLRDEGITLRTKYLFLLFIIFQKLAILVIPKFIRWARSALSYHCPSITGQDLIRSILEHFDLKVTWATSLWSDFGSSEYWEHRFRGKWSFTSLERQNRGWCFNESEYFRYDGGPTIQMSTYGYKRQ